MDFFFQKRFCAHFHFHINFAKDVFYSSIWNGSKMDGEQKQIPQIHAQNLDPIKINSASTQEWNLNIISVSSELYYYLCKLYANSQFIYLFHWSLI